MEPHFTAEVYAQVSCLERSQKKLQLLTGFCCMITLGTVWVAWQRATPASASEPNPWSVDKDGIMHVRGLVVDDAVGRERLRLGAPLPDPLQHGMRVKRSGILSGLLITDASQTERGGYVTNDQGEAFLSLDAPEEQQVLFLVNPHGGVNFDLYDKSGNEASLTLFPSGPRFKLKKNGNTVVDLPESAAGLPQKLR